MSPVTASFSVGVISWNGMYEAAAAIAEAVAPHAREVVVVHSEATQTRRHGAGRWITVHNDLFFGRKFAVLLEKMTTGAPLLLVQADAQCEDWGNLLTRCASAFRTHPELGVWAPLIDNTPYPAERTALQQFDQQDLVEVLNCDAIVLGLAAPIVDRLRALDYSENNLGWGVDWAAVSIAATTGRKTVVDSGLHVHHPLARGYENSEALSQMHAFMTQFTPAERAIFDAHDRRLQQRSTERNGQNHMLVSRLAKRGGGPHVDALMKQVAFMSVSGGRVRLCVPEHAATPELALRVDADKRTFTALPAPALTPLIVNPLLSEEPGGFSWVPAEGSWRCPGQETLRAVFEPGAQNRKVRLAENVVIPAECGDVTLVLGAANHRCTADLHIAWVDIDDPGASHETYVALDTSFSGTVDKGDVQSLRLRLPATGGGRVLTLTLCMWHVGHDGDKPGVVFVTRPVLLPTLEAEAPTVPLMAIGAAPVKPGAHWLEATFPSTARELALEIGDTRLPIPLDLDTGVTLRETQDGPTLSAPKPMAAVLCVGGRPTRRLWLGPVPQVVGPASLDAWSPGRRLELRDATNSTQLVALDLGSDLLKD